MKRTFCDICDKELKDDEFRFPYEVTANKVVLKIYLENGEDLCLDCIKKVVVQGIPVKHEKSNHDDLVSDLDDLDDCIEVEEEEEEEFFENEET